VFYLGICLIVTILHDHQTRQRCELYKVPFRLKYRSVFLAARVGEECNSGTVNDCCCFADRCRNVAEALVSKGLATVVRYRQGDDQRSSCYDDLLKAEDRAEKKAVGVHSKKESPIIRVADISGVSLQCGI